MAKSAFRLTKRGEGDDAEDILRKMDICLREKDENISDIEEMTYEWSFTFFFDNTFHTTLIVI